MKKTVRLGYWIALAATSLIAFTCRDNSTGPTTSNVLLTAEDVGVTETWLHLQLANGFQHPGILTLTRNDSIIARLFTPPSDTLIVDTNLRPKTTYTYRAKLFDSIFIEQSDPLAVTTMDTTSHNWSGQVFTLGLLGSTIRDVAIVNDTCAWAVGEIYNYDSAGQSSPTLYNAARWNGKDWKLLRITRPLYNYDCTVAGHYPLPLYTVFAFQSGSVIFDALVISTGDSLTYLPCIPRDALSGGILKMWGLSERDFYAAGSNGTVIHYNGSWHKLQSGTTLNIMDIVGATNSKTGELEIMAVASLPYTSYERKILKISGTTVTTLFDGGIQIPLTGVWFVPGREYYVVGDSIYTRRNPSDSGTWSIDIGSYYTMTSNWAVRGNGLNDVVVAGDFGNILHFNGYTWKIFRQTTSGFYYSVAMRGNDCCSRR